MTTGVYVSNYRVVENLLEHIKEHDFFNGTVDYRLRLNTEVDTTSQNMKDTLTVAEVARERGEQGAYDNVTIYINFFGNIRTFNIEKLQKLGRVFGSITSPSRLPKGIVSVGTASPFTVIKETGRPVAHYLATVQYRVANCVMTD